MIHIPGVFAITDPYVYPENSTDPGHKHRLEYKRTSANGDRPVYLFLCIRCGVLRVISKSLFWAENK